MHHDTASCSDLPAIAATEVTAQLSRAILVMPQVSPPLVAQPAASRRGRPVELSEPHLWLGLLWAVLEGLGGYRALTRYLATHVLGRFAPVSLTDSALLQR